MKRFSLSGASLLCVLALTGCATSSMPHGNRSSTDDAFSQQVILVTVAPGLNADFVTDTRKLAQIPGVVSLRIARPVDFGPEHKRPRARARRDKRPLSIIANPSSRQEGTRGIQLAIGREPGGLR